MRVFNDNIIRILAEARQTLSRGGWTRRAMARDASGNSCSLRSDDAVAYCAWASVVKAWRKIDPQNEDFYFSFFEQKFAQVLSAKYGYQFTVTRWNDEVASSVAEVMTLIDAVAAAMLPAPQAVVLKAEFDQPAAALDWSHGLFKFWRVAERSARSIIGASTPPRVF